MNHNFPQNLHIHPTAPAGDQSGNFSVESQEEAIRRFGIAGKVWEAAYILKDYIDPPQDHIFDPPLFRVSDGRRIVELGSGSGIVAATLANALNSTDIMFVTDLPEVCPLLQQNLCLSETIRVRPLSWGDKAHADCIASELSPSPLTHIICSDLVYFPDLLAPLLRSLIHLTSHPFVAAPSDVQLVISYKIRSLAKETPFWSMFGVWFDFAPVLVQKTSGGPWQRLGVGLEDPTFVFVARRREESYGWDLPPNDVDVMHGVVSRGSLAPMSDDTFETLLLMSLE
ncbi:putative methyltransferase-domain-containing protein [Roridomyces roridus]|uniref:Methyltransferase-domain-containing protein n=1 Tax=Roridomyces roridus TaxID=1738132 RepID=A0AAD7CIS0_9AGAR|nr:putative methyltransferase-domain-containing protein [Roridomyces roridus]